jgi:hypothetical protein
LPAGLQLGYIAIGDNYGILEFQSNLICKLAIPVVEFSREGYKFRKIIG